MGLVTESDLTARDFFCRHPGAGNRGSFPVATLKSGSVLVEFHRRAWARATLGVPLANRSVGFTDWREHTHHRRRLEELTPVYLYSYIPPRIGYSRSM